MPPKHDLAEIKAKATAALADPNDLVEWNHDNSSSIVSDILDLAYDGAMQFILEEIEQLDPECWVETKPYGADVYRHDARGREWYVKFSLDRSSRLFVMSFHPPTTRLRPAGTRVRLKEKT